ncbi:MAG: translation initiation factor IF-2, partial [Alistipes sp.]|nr:translation initiation factor IF-2 [Alistipes sp.]
MPRLSKVTKELNVGLQTCVDFLQKKGHTVENSLNAKINDEQYELLVMQFSKDKDLRLKAEQAQRERISSKLEAKAEAKAAEESKKEEAKKETPAPKQEEEKPSVGFKVVGKIDLDAPKKAEPKEEPQAEAPKSVELPKEEPQTEVQPEPQVEEQPAVVEEAPVEEVPAPLAEEEAPVVAETPHVTEPATQDEPAEAPAEEQPKAETEVFAVKRPEFVSKINVVGKVDLSAINQSTRPKKKSKEEKKKEREEQAAQRRQQATAGKPAGQGDGQKKKRARIQNERVDINKAGQQAANENRGGNNGGGNQGGKNQGGKGNDPHRAKFDRDKERAKRILDKAEMSEEEIQKQVKDTLARLTNKPKSTGAKHRKEKRNQAADRLQQQMAQEHAESKVLKLTEFVTANELANMMNVGVTQVIGTCMSI